MKQQSEFRSEANSRETLRQASGVHPRESEPPNRKARNAVPAAPQTFTSRMIDYRSWWNLPGPKARKTHS